MNDNKKADAPLHGAPAAMEEPSREQDQYTPTPPPRQEAERPSYFAVLPAKVRYDEELRPNAKLLFAEITALTNARGYAWISNERLGEWFALSPKTVGSLIQQLAQRGLIYVEVTHDEKTQAITGRRIWLEKPDTSAAPPILKIEDSPLKNEDSPILKNEEKNNTSTGVNNIPPYNPPKGDCASSNKQRRRRETKEAPDWEPEMFARFWKSYPRGEDKQKAIKAWDRLKPDRKLMMIMSAALARDKASDEWQRGIGIPYACRWLTGQRWTDEHRARPESSHPVREEAAPEWI